MLIIIIIVVYAAAVDCTQTSSHAPAEDVQNPLLESLRRQLMENNYDYQSMEEERARRAQIDSRAAAAAAASDYQEAGPEGRFHVVDTRAEGGEYENMAFQAANETPQFKVHDKEGQEFKVHDKVVGLDVLSLRDSKRGPHFRSGLDKSFEAEKSSQVVSKTDLLYYVDENRLRRSQEPGEDYHQQLRDKAVDYEEMYPHDDDTTTPKVKYKLLKVRERSPTRRNAPVRRFLKERGSEGVAFMSLDAAPFPLFKLPRSRRQYMRDSGEELQPADTEEDLPPPGAGSHHNSREDI